MKHSILAGLAVMTACVFAGCTSIEDSFIGDKPANRAAKPKSAKTGAKTSSFLDNVPPPFQKASATEKTKSSLRALIAAQTKILGEDTWHGFQRIRFDFQGRQAWIVLPSVAPAAGNPWTWTMQWADAFVDRTGVPDMLRKGYYHVTIDLFDTRMNETGLMLAADYQAFLVQKLGLAPKARLIGMSWGGFFSIRYAAAYPHSVAKIYLDAPLLTFKNFSHSDIGPWKSMKPAGDWSADVRMPVNMAATVANAGIPILLLYGGVDKVVPPDVNCETFAKRFKAAGGNIRIHARANFAHHPHGFDPDKTAPIVDFFSAK